jgi:hypothetical protein
LVLSYVAIGQRKKIAVSRACQSRRRDKPEDDDSLKVLNCNTKVAAAQSMWQASNGAKTIAGLRVTGGTQVVLSRERSANASTLSLPDNSYDRAF